MIFRLNKNVTRKLHKFAENEISFSEMKEMVLDLYTPMKIYTRRLDGSRYIGDMFTVAGPSGNVDYDYEAKGYMIVYNSDAVGFRTIVFKNVYKIEKEGVTYMVR
jgi:hypothetical protein|tara:strand:- start:199 stop:513 length:315 start_codon:yes stop_codon:yes gene_type:complete